MSIYISPFSDFCQSEIKFGVKWPRAKTGEEITVECSLADSILTGIIIATCINRPLSFHRWRYTWFLLLSCIVTTHFLGCILCFHSRGQHLCKFIGTKESVYIRKEFNSHRTGLGHKHGSHFIVLGHKYGHHDVIRKHTIQSYI